MPDPRDTTEFMHWNFDVPLITNRYVLRDTAKAILWTVLISGVILGSVFGLAGGKDAFLGAMMLVLGFGIFMAVMAVFTLAVYLGNRNSFAYAVDEQGIGQVNTSRRARFAHHLAYWMALFTGKPQLAGAGLAAKAQEVIEIPWDCSMST